MKFVHLILFCSFCLSSCYVTCTTDPAFVAEFRGFSTAEQSYVVERQYKKNTNFSTLIAVTIWADTFSAWSVRNDTTFEPFSSRYSKGFVLDPNYDYEIDVPNAAATYRVKNMETETITGPYPGSDWECSKAATWYLNDTLHSFAGVKPVKHGMGGDADIVIYR